MLGEIASHKYDDSIREEEKQKCENILGLREKYFETEKRDALLGNTQRLEAEYTETINNLRDSYEKNLQVQSYFEINN